MGIYTTPTGIPIHVTTRDRTNDAMVATSIIVEDEYGLLGLNLTGTALDIGAHIGAASLLLAAEYPYLKIIAVEPIPENVELLRANALLNGWDRRIRVIEGMAGPAGPVAYRYGGSEMAEMHTFIGNQPMPANTTQTIINPPGLSLGDLFDLATTPIALVKLDCEGCEYATLRDPRTRDVPLIVGEYHRGTTGILEALDATHTVTFGGGEHDGLFRAVRR